MIEIKCEQGSAKWLLARLGKPTASMYGNIVTPTGKAVTDTKRDGYMMKLLAERITGRATEVYVSAAMDRGNRLEPEARAWYEMQNAVEVAQIGFALHDEGRWGASPDGIIADDGGIEIKTAVLHNHIAKLLDGKAPSENIVQIQGCMYVTGRKWWDYCLFGDYANVPNMVVRVERDEVMMEALAECLLKFCDELDEAERELRQRYGIPERNAVDLDSVSDDWCPWPDEPLQDERKAAQ